MVIQFFLTLSILTVILSSCTVGPNHKVPEITLPEKFSEGEIRSLGNISTLPWWTAFNDDHINQLVKVVLNQNLTLLQAMERITAAKESVTASESGSFPTLVTSSSNTLSNSTGENNKLIRNTASAGFNVSWLIDLFGQYRRAKESSLANLDATYASADVVRLSIISNLLSSYIDARYYQERLSIAYENLASRKQTLELTRFKLNAGAASKLDVVQAEALVNTTLSAIPDLEKNFRISVNNIALLIAQPSDKILAYMKKKRQQPIAFIKTNVGIPADLIRNRPDIRQAERKLASYVAKIGVAQSQLYPSLSLNGSIFFSNISTRQASSDLSPWSLGPSIKLPIFDGRYLQSNLKIAESAAREQYLVWKTTVLNAIKEVEDTLVSVHRDRKTLSARRAQVNSYKEALSLSTASYRDGIASLLDVLDAQRSVASAQVDFSTSAQQLAKDYVNLNIAIGGGYSFTYNRKNTSNH
ncbi:RND efflux system, outer membrane lipoprotein CmeC [Liberibacter crescens BT-1]|uniref:RND efflux system, outer membrane lipoprotein CmeC n=1 Tax=Liberibacter crescens (strain BT-1) TaxID=1215343 RepID=L0EVU9_LIBCB|nr:efflux transporter outer membrane subunit [Liberibacter crescens]AGA64980.1 RND efflux system, outer membrane lipoprotein CmeC [Liberibacter crescens BT-1]AMC13387.1 nodulation protein NodT [Liberibacter crescens]